jgi:hypothetical protein
MNNGAAETTHDESIPAESRRVVISASEWMRWNDVAVTTDTLPPPFDLNQPADRSPTAETSRQEAEAS